MCLLVHLSLNKRLQLLSAHQLVPSEPPNGLISHWMDEYFVFLNRTLIKQKSEKQNVVKSWQKYASWILSTSFMFIFFFFFQRDASQKKPHYSLFLKWTLFWSWSSFLLSPRPFLSLSLLFIYDLVAYIRFCSRLGSLCECLMMHANTNKTMKILEHWCWTQRVESSLDLTDFFSCNWRERVISIFKLVKYIHKKDAVRETNYTPSFSYSSVQQTILLIWW